MTDELNSKLTYSTAETQIGIMDGNKLVYRKIAKIPMTNFVNVSSGYDLLYLGIGVLATQIISINMLAYRSSDNRTDALPYSGTGTVFNTWFAGVTVKNGETVLKFHNNVYWGSAYTLIATIEYTKS